jgi:hypothetical protein
LHRPSRGGFAAILDGTFGLLGATWTTSLAAGALAFLPAAVLYGWAWQRTLAAYTAVYGRLDPAGPSPAAILGRLFLPLAAAALVQGLATLFVRACVTDRAVAALRGERASPARVAGRVLRRHGARLVGQRVLQGLLYGAVFAAILVAAVVVIAIAPSDAAPATPVALFLLFYLAGFAAWVGVWVRCSFTLEAVVIDGAAAGRSFRLSAALVRRGWWRVFGARLLFALMLGFAASLVATPVVFFATLRAYARWLAGAVAGSTDATSLPEMIRAMGTGLPLRLAIFSWLQGLLTALLAPVFMTLLYLERKRRQSDEAAALPAGTA